MMQKRTILESLPHLLQTVDVAGLGTKHQGKVRDFYQLDGKRILITTDRISAFDRVLGLIPYKGQVLNQLAAFWFDKTKDIVQNHMITVAHPNVSIAKEAKPYPVEMVVRGYITGVTSTAIWRSYEQGERVIYGIRFPEGLRKNEKLKEPILTPTTKAEHGAHDEKLTHDQILKNKLIPSAVLDQMERVSLALYKRGNEICQKRGLILVDTKYEFADYNGKLMLIDEIHTPDSSRFWVGESYRERFAKGLEPENFDKEFFRIWYTKQGYRGNGEPPKMSRDLQVQTALRYIKIYELITRKKFVPNAYPLEEGIKAALIPKRADRVRRPAPAEARMTGSGMIGVLLGSSSDKKWGESIAKHLADFDVSYKIHVASAHKTPEYLMELIKKYEAENKPVVYICVAGRSNALGGFVDAQVIHPVINCPPASEKYGGLDILSSLRMPSGVAPVTVLEPDHAALAAVKILALSDKKLEKKIQEYQQKNREKIIHAEVE